MGASYNALGHVKKMGRTVDMKSGLTSDPRFDQYQKLPSFMTFLGDRNGAAKVSEKSLVDVGAENWQFYDPSSSFKILSNAEISQKTAELKLLMHEKNADAI